MTFEISKEEAQYILNALGQRPFAEVYKIIRTMQEQAAKQIAQQDGRSAAVDDHPTADLQVLEQRQRGQ